METTATQPIIATQFTVDYYADILRRAQKSGYTVVTLAEFIRRGCPGRLHFISRHDVDMKPVTLASMLEVERKLDVPSTTFVRVMGPDYNPFSYPVFTMLREAEACGMEVGLHTNFLEFATITGTEPYEVLQAEVHALRRFFKISGLSCHRDINYIHNSLPLLEERWDEWRRALELEYQAYEHRIVANTVYVNEGLSPHLCWRHHRPEDVIPSGSSICLLTHNHWWYRSHPFEA